MTITTKICMQFWTKKSWQTKLFGVRCFGTHTRLPSSEIHWLWAWRMMGRLILSSKSWNHGLMCWESAKFSWLHLTRVKWALQGYNFDCKNWFFPHFRSTSTKLNSVAFPHYWLDRLKKCKDRKETLSLCPSWGPKSEKRISAQPHHSDFSRIQKESTLLLLGEGEL